MFTIKSFFVLFALAFATFVLSMPVDSSTDKRCQGQCYPMARDEVPEVVVEQEPCVGRCSSNKRDRDPAAVEINAVEEEPECLGLCQTTKRNDVLDVPEPVLEAEEKRCQGQCYPMKRDEDVTSFAEDTLFSRGVASGHD